MAIESLGIAWYKRGEYAEILNVMVDRDDLQDSFEEWLANAERVEAELTGAGFECARVYIDPRSFASWCIIRGLVPNAKARSRFASDPANWPESPAAARAFTGR